VARSAGVPRIPWMQGPAGSYSGSRPISAAPSKGVPQGGSSKAPTMTTRPGPASNTVAKITQYGGGGGA
jgi:hypothetical protein